MTPLIQKAIVTDTGESEFQLRLLKNEGVGLVTDRAGKHHLLLDSIDHWYDLIQEGYPKKKKCGCKNDWFTLSLLY